MAGLSRLWRDVIQPWADSQQFPPSQAAMARAFQVSRTTVGNWRDGSSQPSPANVRTIHRVTGTPYLAVLNAVLHDQGYLVSEELDDGTAIEQQRWKA